MKRLAILLALPAWLMAQAPMPSPIAGGPGAGTENIACSGSPGNTVGTYRQLCETSAGVLWACNNSAGCSVAADWVNPSAASVNISCAGTPGDTTAAYLQLCEASGVIYACNNSNGCTMAADWVANGGGVTAVQSSSSIIVTTVGGVATPAINGAYPGVQGAGFGPASSATSLTPGAGAISWTMTAGLAYSAGACVQLYSTGSGAYINVPLSTYNSTTGAATGTVTAAAAGTCSGYSGSGAHTDWAISPTGLVGMAGTPSTGPSVLGSVSVSSTDTSDTITYSVTLSSAAAYGSVVCVPSAGGSKVVVPQDIAPTTTGMTISWNPSAGFTGTCVVTAGPTGPTGPTGSGGVYPAMSAPATAAFSWLNPNSYSPSATSKTARTVITIAPSSVGLAFMQNAALPATPYTIDLGFYIHSAGDIVLAGIALKNSGANALRTYGFRCNSDVAWHLSDQSWTSVTAPGGENNAAGLSFWQGQLWFVRITDDGTNRRIYASYNGTDYELWLIQASGTGVSPNQAGIVFYNNDATFVETVVVYHWLVSPSILPQYAN